MKPWLFNVALLLLVVPVLHAQRALFEVPPPILCKPANIDATFSFTDIPAGHQAIVITLRNSTPQPCTLRGELTPGFAVDGHGAIVKTCWFCTPDGHTDNAAVRQNDKFILPGGDSARVEYQWLSIGDTCQKVDWVSFGTEWDGRASFLFSANRWKPHVCSVMQISGYEAVAGYGLGPTFALPAVSGTDAALQVTSPSTPVYEDEWVKLTLELKSRKGTILPTGRCPELYAVYGDGAGTRFEPIYPEGYGTLVNNGSSQPNGEYISGYGDELPAEFKGRQRLCDATGRNNTTTVLLPASLRAPIHVTPTPNLSSLSHVVWRAATAGTNEPVFVTADTQFNILDPETLPPNWGPEISGLGAGLSVDRVSFKLGETIPLHLHWQNFAATATLGVTECGEPGPQLEVQDASHHVLSLLSTDSFGCSGHGWGPFSIQRGKPQHDSIRLDYGLNGYMLPGGQVQISEPGIYYLVLVWSPRTLVEKAEQPGIVALNERPTFGNTYATARSLPVRIEILPTRN